MRTARSAILRLCVLGALTTSGWTCNDAEDGFHAEQGSTVSAPSGGTFAIPPGGSVFVFHTFSVTDSRGDPQSDIEVQLLCINCDIRDTADANGGPIRSVDDTEVQDTPYFVRTNGAGFYQIVIELESPANVGLSTYTAEVGHEIGVAGAKTTYTVNVP